MPSSISLHSVRGTFDGVVFHIYFFTTANLAMPKIFPLYSNRTI
jgi:hypothetical protein